LILYPIEFLGIVYNPSCALVPLILTMSFQRYGRVLKACPITPNYREN